MSTPKRFVSWAAVSSLPQAKKVSLDDQLRENREHIDRHGGQLVEELVVPGESRNIILFEDACRRMTAYGRLKELIEARAFDVLIYLNRSRLGRKASLSMAVVELCHEVGIITYETESPPVSLDALNSNGFDARLIGAIHSVGAQDEIERLKKRHNDGMKGRVERGNFACRAGWGWLEKYDERGRRHYEIDPEAQRVLWLIIDRYLEHGRGSRTIVEELNALGHKAPEGGLWGLPSFRGIMHRMLRYAGYSELNKQSKTGRPYTIAPGKWPALITLEQAQSVLEEQRRRKAARRSVGSTHRLSQCLWCAQCNRRMVAQWSTHHRNGGTQIYEDYYCPNKHRVGSIAASKVYPVVAEAIEYLQSASNRAKLFEESPNRIAPLEAELGDLAKREESLASALQRADDAWVDGTMTEERHKRQVARLAAQGRELVARRAAIEHQIAEERHLARRDERLLEVAQNGMAMLQEPDISIANAWFRRHLELWLGVDGKLRVKYL